MKNWINTALLALIAALLSWVIYELKDINSTLGYIEVAVERANP